MPIDVTRFVHVNINCSNLERSKRFYERFVDLEPVTHTNPDPQDGAGFGLDTPVQWDGWIFHSPAAGDGNGAVDLLEWTLPKPGPPPYAELSHLGIVRLVVGVPDIDAHYERVTGAGISCMSAPTEIPLGSGNSARAYCAPDPDGTWIEFVQDDGHRLLRVDVNCSSIERSGEFYSDVLGLEVSARSQPGPVPGEAFGVDGEVEWDALLLGLPPERGSTFAVRLVEWKQPRPVGAAYGEPHHLGLYRLAMLVADIDAGHEELRRAGVECVSPPVDVALGPASPVQSVRALLFKDPDGTCLELIEAPRVAG